MLQDVARSVAVPGETTSSPGRIVIQAWLASRGLIVAVALLLAVLQHRTLSDMVSNWDVEHFARLAGGGYSAEPGGTLMAFFPGWPLILSLFGQLGVPVVISGVILATACSAVAAAALYRLGGPWAAVAWLFAPTAVFTMVPYTESMFCAAAFWAWERARSDRWLAAAVLTAVACTVRVSGLFLIGALLVMIFTSTSRGWRQAASRGTDADSGVGDHDIRGVSVCSYRELDGLVPRTGDRLGARADLALAVLLEHNPRHRPWRVRQSSVVGRGVPRRDHLHGGRRGSHRLVHRGELARAEVADGTRQADVGRGQLGRSASAGVLHVVLVLLGQPRHSALVPVMDHARSLGGGTIPAFSTCSPAAGGGCVHRRNCAHAVVELVVLHRPLGELNLLSEITRNSGGEASDHLC